MNACIAIVSDMIFATRITATAKKVGTSCRIVGNANALTETLDTGSPQIALVDMAADGALAEDAIRTVKSRSPGTRVIAFFSHVQTELQERAEAAGADDIWPRSVFVQRLEQILAAASGSPPSQSK